MTPIVILKLEHYGSLGIIRTLGRLGVPAYGVDINPSAPGFHSRYCTGKFYWDIDKAPQEESVNYLLEIGKQIGTQSILIPTSDDLAIFVADNAERLRQWYIFPRYDAHLVRALCSKKDMYYLANKNEIPTAKTEFPQNREEVLRYAEQAMFPVMLKGIDGNRLEARTGKKMVKVKDKDELLKQYDILEDLSDPNLMLQEYIPGGDDTVWMFNGYFNEQSDCLISFTGKKIRQNPVYTGMTCLGICLKNTAVEETTTKFMKAIGYRGILDIGYRYDARDGKYKVLDINPRVGATFRLFVATNGMDVIRALYFDMTGRRVEPSMQREGRKWVVEDKDIRSCINYFRDGKLTFRDWFTSFRGVEEAGYFAADDMMPVFTMWLTHLKKILNKRILRKTSYAYGKKLSNVF
jgi:predicted ATP-grasp superfamily ATP-dependent carboligase